MTKFGIIGATALSLSLAIATPVLAQHHGGGGGGSVGAGAHASVGGGMAGGGGMRGGGGGMGGGMQVGGGGRAVSGAQASIGAGPRADFSGRTGAQFQSFNGRSGGQFAGREFRGDRNFHDGRGFRHRGFGPGFAVGVGLGYGYGGYYDPYYYDDYAYDDYDVAPGYVVSGGADPAYCAQRYRSYDPASGTYLGYDGLRHPCP
jgi:BA14K-like protein